MIVDLNREKLRRVVNTGVCVVGTGIGGGSFIDRYLKKRSDLVVIEAGGDRESALIQSESVGRDFGLAVTREISLGGTSNVWRGLCSPMDPIDYTGRHWIDNRGWPVGPTEVEPYYIEAGAMLGLPQFSYFAPRSKDHKLGALARHFDFDRKLFSNKYFLHKRPPKNFRHDILGQSMRGEALLLTNAVAVEAVTNSYGTVVEKILAGTPHGDCLEVRAKHFVISAGALETPRILLNSRRWNDQGIGNNYNQVGRFLMDHPMGSLSQVRLDRIRRAPLYHSVNLGPRQHIRTGLVLREELQQEYGLPNHCVYLWPSFKLGIDDRFENLRRALITVRKKRLKTGDLLTLATNPNTVYRILSYFFPIDAHYRFADLFFVTEQVPNPNSTVSLSERKDRFGYPIARINWALTRGDIDSVAAFNELALKALSSDTIRVSFEKSKEQIGESLTSAAHHMGTARMAADAKRGVVDRNLKVWGLENLYICDASVLPTCGNANPSLTICALAIRLADRVAAMR
jgi:choline dehydrogenase-like flavoprotein